MSSFGDTTITGRVTATLAANADNQLIRQGEAKALLNALFKGTWDSGTSYLAGESVNRLGTFYIANLANVNKAPEANPTEWRVGATGGASSFTYIRYATDASGTGFSSSPTGKTYVAFLTTTTAIASPVVGDFAGLWVKFVSDASTLNTDAITEGSTNLYFTAARVRATVLTGLSATTGAIAATDTVLQGFNKAQGRLAAIEAWTTDNLTQGSTNKYFANALAQAAISVSGTPLTYASGVVGINAASANTASYVVQRDANGDFAARKLVLNTATGADHLTFGTSATLGYTGGAATFNVPVKGTKYLFTGYELKLDTGKVVLFDTGSSLTLFEADSAGVRFESLIVSGVTSTLLKTNEDGVVVSGATTDDLTEGSTNLWFTNARADTRADGRITAQKGVASGLASLGVDGKLTSAQIPASVMGGANYQGTWNANANSPALASGTGTKGFYYVVSTAGTTNLDGVTTWSVGDWAIYNGTAWQKVDNTDAVLSVNSLTGAVTLTTDSIAESGSPTNKWFTDTRARAALSIGSDTMLSYSAGVFGLKYLSFVESDIDYVSCSERFVADSIVTALIEASVYGVATQAEVNYLTGVTSAIQTQLNAKLALTGGVITQAAASSGSPTALTVTGGAHLTLAASTESPDLYFNFDRVVQFATGALTTQRAIRIAPPKYAFVAASTVTDAVTLEIGGAPVAWTNATLTNTYALRIRGADVAGGSASAFGLHVTAPTGAASNYAAHFAGTVRLDGTFRVKADDGNYYNVTLTVSGGIPTWSIT